MSNSKVSEIELLTAAIAQRNERGTKRVNQYANMHYNNAYSRVMTDLRLLSEKDTDKTLYKLSVNYSEFSKSKLELDLQACKQFRANYHKMRGYNVRQAVRTLCILLHSDSVEEKVTLLKRYKSLLVKQVHQDNLFNVIDSKIKSIEKKISKANKRYYREKVIIEKRLSDLSHLSLNQL